MIDNAEDSVAFEIENEIQTIHSSLKRIESIVEKGVDFTKLDSALDELEKQLAEVVALNQELYANHLEMQRYKYAE